LCLVQLLWGRRTSGRLSACLFGKSSAPVSLHHTSSARECIIPAPVQVNMHPPQETLSMSMIMLASCAIHSPVRSRIRPPLHPPPTTQPDMIGVSVCLGAYLRPCMPTLRTTQPFPRAYASCITVIIWTVLHAPSETIWMRSST
jgi:hypothetical protein